MSPCLTYFVGPADWELPVRNCLRERGTSGSPRTSSDIFLVTVFCAKFEGLVLVPL